MNTSEQARKFFLTINNPAEKGLDHNRIIEQLSTIKAIKGWIMADEEGEEGTPHTHLYLYCSSPTRFSTIKRRLPEAHIEIARGTTAQNKSYIFKEGSFNHGEFGEFPSEGSGAKKRSVNVDLLNLIEQGMTNAEIMRSLPGFALRMDKVEQARQILREEQFREVFRELEVIYVFGKTRTGKTSNIMEYYGYSNVYRVTNYEHPFDLYKGQDVIIFDEFKNSQKIHDMLNYLDGYPLPLPCRYTDRIACYTKVFIVSNTRLEDQYNEVQQKNNATWEAFIARINKVREFCDDGSITTCTTDEYFNKINNFDQGMTIGRNSKRGSKNQ